MSPSYGLVWDYPFYLMQALEAMNNDFAFFAARERLEAIARFRMHTPQLVAIMQAHWIRRFEFEWLILPHQSQEIGMDIRCFASREPHLKAISQTTFRFHLGFFKYFIGDTNAHLDFKLSSENTLLMRFSGRVCSEFFNEKWGKVSQCGKGSI